MDASITHAEPDSDAADRTVLAFGLLSLVAAVLAWAYAWRGGLWAAPMAVAAFVVAGRRAGWRPEGSVAVAGMAMATISAVMVGIALLTSGAPGPALRTDASTYAPGDEVRIQLRAGVLGVGYNLCHAFASLEVGGETGWRPVPASLAPPDGRLHGCTSEQRRLPPLLGDTGMVHVPADIEPGEYRVAYDLETTGWSRAAVSTGSFTVLEHR